MAPSHRLTLTPPLSFSAPTEPGKWVSRDPELAATLPRNYATLAQGTLKLKGIDGRAPPGVEPVAQFDSTRENLPGPDIVRIDRLRALS